MVLKHHPICDRYFSDYMRLATLSFGDSPEVREVYHRRARIAWNALLEICRLYYQNDPHADLICKSYDIYRLTDVCYDFFLK
jgi:hypothetical protein